MLIKEQIRKYKVKMEEINQLEAAESFAFRRLSLLRQNTVSVEIKHQLLGEGVLLILSIHSMSQKSVGKKQLPKAVGRS